MIEKPFENKDGDCMDIQWEEQSRSWQSYSEEILGKLEKAQGEKDNLMSDLQYFSDEVKQLRSRHDQWEAIAHQLANTLIAHPNNVSKHQEILRVYENIKNQTTTHDGILDERDRWHDLVHEVWKAFEPLNIERMAELMRIYEENMH
jgi:hypothetical protein